MVLLQLKTTIHDWLHADTTQFDFWQPVTEVTHSVAKQTSQAGAGDMYLPTQQTLFNLDAPTCISSKYKETAKKNIVRRHRQTRTLLHRHHSKESNFGQKVLPLSQEIALWDLHVLIKDLAGWMTNSPRVLLIHLLLNWSFLNYMYITSQLTGTMQWQYLCSSSSSASNAPSSACIVWLSEAA